jgi:hypothetical protein
MKYLLWIYTISACWFLSHTYAHDYWATVRLSRIGLKPLAVVPLMCTILDRIKYIKLAETRLRNSAPTMLLSLAATKITMWLMDISAQYTPMGRM